ncbi:alpha/beta-hydrolase [Mycena sp. CBHHK59/15]|nr:alpha/beta-hydrolase [Mycena sp. CBHHK59/15]
MERATEKAHQTRTPHLGLQLESRRRSWFCSRQIHILLATVILASVTLLSSPSRIIRGSPSTSFYFNISEPRNVCMDVKNRTASHAGHIGLKGDSEDSPKRSFFWYFEAEEDSANAPVILTMGGGPGTSGMMNALFGQSPCLATADGLKPNPDRWTEHHNLIALDHPIGVGFSYGSRVNNSRSAADDVYDFLQKFFVLYPHLTRNKFVISGGSYGGVYVPNIATVIHEQNLLLKSDKGQPGAVHINLEALILSNPFSDPISHFRWLLQYRCMDHQFYNSTACVQLYSKLPVCLETIQMALEIPTVPNRVSATELCYFGMNADSNGTVGEDIRRKCFSDEHAPEACHPEFSWVGKIFGDAQVRKDLGLSKNLNYTALNMEVNQEFLAAGDLMQAHHLLYPPLLSAGIRVLHYIGAQDANCPWPGIFSSLKLLQTPFQQEFNNAPDVPWPSADIATVRTVGAGAGSMAYILLAEAGHFVVKDQPALAKRIVEHWVANRPFLWAVSPYPRPH